MAQILLNYFIKKVLKEAVAKGQDLFKFGKIGSVTVKLVELNNILVIFFHSPPLLPMHTKPCP